MVIMLTRLGGNPQRCMRSGHRDNQATQATVATMEIKEQLTKGDMQSILRMSKLLSDVSNDFKTYHFSM